MALNFSHRPIFPAHLSEDNLVTPIRIANGYFVEGVPGDGFVKPWNSNREVDDCFEYEGDRAHESVSNDILDVLPADPFGMDMSTTFTAITGWLEDLEVGYGGYGKNQIGASKGDYELFAGLNFFWNNAMRFHSLPTNSNVDNNFNMGAGFDVFTEEKEIGGVSCQVEDIVRFNNENDCISGQIIEEVQEGSRSCEGYDGSPHPSLLFALGYAGVRDLLAAEGVCRSLRCTVRSDPLLWRNIHIDQPLNEKITDDILLELTNRAQGNLQCLSLVECPRITDDGLERVLASNLKLTKLSVPGCTRLSIEGIVNRLKTFKATSGQGIKNLRIGGLYGVTQKHFEELKLLLGTDNHIQPIARKPHFYHRGNLYLSCDDDRAIDIEMCPKCQNLRLIYDCPADGCQGKEQADEVCRACTLCIARCVQCGCCINDSEYEETFCLELLCAGCWKQLLKCQEKHDRKIGHTKYAIFHESSCSFCG